MPSDFDVQLDRWECSGLRLASGPHALEVGRIVLHRLSAQLRIDNGAPRLQTVTAAEAELSDVKVEGPLGLPAAGHAREHAGDWTLDPLATADGTLRAEIVDAHLLFDAQVTVPIGRGVIDFARARVEHVGPDSRMGVSRMGIHVDAPNGRSYLYQFPHATVAGVTYERRSPLPGGWTSNRGSLQLQPFLEALLRQGPAGATSGVTGQARLLLGRTAAGGELQLGDGRFALPGLRGELAGRTAGRNSLRLHSEAVGRGISLAMDALSIRQAMLSHRGMRLGFDEIAGRLSVRLFSDDAQLRFALNGTDVKLTGLRLARDPTVSGG